MIELNILLLGLFWLLLSTNIVFPTNLFGASLDLRNSSDESGEYEIAFCARPSPDDSAKNLPGHAFVSFSYYSPDGNRKFMSIGHTVQPGISQASTIWSYFGESVDGYLAEEKYTSIKQSCLVVKVNKSDYDKSFLLTVDPLKQMKITSSENHVIEAYKLGSKDCIGFMIEVAKILELKGFKIPNRKTGDLPLAYIERLISSNTPKIIVPEPEVPEAPEGFRIRIK